MMEELVSLARTQRDELTLVNVGGYYVADLFEIGRPDAAKAEADAYCRFVEGLPLPQTRWRAVALRASVAALEARYVDAHALGDELQRVASESGAKHGLVAWALFQIALTICDRDTEHLTLPGGIATIPFDAGTADQKLGGIAIVERADGRLVVGQTNKLDGAWVFQLLP
jgi:hypothetical protein